MGRIKFYMDEHISKAVVKGLRQRNVDILMVTDVDMVSAPDEEHLSFAHKQGRVIFTQDEDFLKLHASGMDHSGIVYTSQQASISKIIQGLLLI